ncbi:hypothetical protein [Henriciella mobilis]|uniref:Glycerophosphoryl diester phosphodiesterase membrane domain-containing protein n=1 Tax=Henriciella mobilis TaxID=2305467 RepID=A0A399REE4_9PROT|nr:hypothetical protein [Henriciella mobilis]RIJ28417.1 hypothetical protein D1223_13605 [Henriciella mobilis]
MSAVLPKPAALMRDAFTNARSIALPTLPGLLLFAAAMGGQSWFNRLAADGSSFMLLWMCVSLVTIFVGCFWSADMYRKLMPDSGVRTVFVDAGRLFLASLAVYGLYFIVGFLLTLFFSIFAGILIGTAGYDPSENAGSTEAVWESIRALSNSGGAVLLYILLFVAAAGLVWLGLRLFLFGAATVGERRLTIFRSWSWTSGHVSRIALLWVVLQLAPWIVLTLLASGFLHLMGVDTIFSFTTAGQGPTGDAAVPAGLYAGLTSVATLIMAPFYWLGHGLAVTLYNQLAPNRVDPDATFG